MTDKVKYQKYYWKSLSPRTEIGLCDVATGKIMNVVYKEGDTWCSRTNQSKFVDAASAKASANRDMQSDNVTIMDEAEVLMETYGHAFRNIMACGRKDGAKAVEIARKVMADPSAWLQELDDVMSDEEVKAAFGVGGDKK